MTRDHTLYEMKFCTIYDIVPAPNHDTCRKIKYCDDLAYSVNLAFATQYTLDTFIKGIVASYNGKNH